MTLWLARGWSRNLQTRQSDHPSLCSEGCAEGGMAQACGLEQCLVILHKEAQLSMFVLPDVLWPQLA